MDSFFYIKYGELTLKGKNRSNFTRCLYLNVLKALKKFTFLKISQSFDHMLIKNIEKYENKILTILSRIPGIFQIIKAYEVQSNKINEIFKSINLLINKIDFYTFKVKTIRHDKSYPINSMEISRIIGAMILKHNKDKKVLMENPDLAISLEIKNNSTIIYFKKHQGIGGFPVGINGRVLTLISGGIDSPVAASLLLKKGMFVDFITFITPPHTSSKSLDKVKKLIKKITLNGLLNKSRLFIVNFTYLQNELSHIENQSYKITLMRRCFYRIAQKIVKKYKYDAIATGESLGQVASQTIESMKVISSVLDNDIVVLRPLLTYDKLEIINIAKKIGTYDISILPYEDCCSLFVPKSPIIKPSIETASKIENQLPLINDLIDDTINEYIKIINI